MPNATPTIPASEQSRERSNQDTGWRSLLVRGGRMIKYKGIVGSVAPHLASAGLVALGVVAFSGSAANAGTCSTSDNINFECSGAEGAPGTDTPIVINNPGTTTVTTDPAGFGIDANGTAITILGSGTGDVSFTDDNESAITGTVHGIYVSGNNAGSINITTNGVITAGNTGVLAPMGGNSTGLTIDVNDINAGGHGINMVGNAGTGDVSVTAHDIDAGSNGINFDNGPQTHDFTVDVNSIKSGANGIYGFPSGNGDVSITVRDSIVAVNNGILMDVDASAGAGSVTFDIGNIEAGGEGINLDTNSNTTDLSIRVNDIDSGASGIHFVHRGSGDTTVVANDITSTTGIGVWFDTDGTTKDLTLDVNNITAGNDGINAVHSGDGSVNIKVSGSIVSGDDAIELYLDNNAVKDVTLDINNAKGADNGIHVIDISDAIDPTDPDAVNNDLTITTRGNIEAGTGWGIYTDTDPGVMTRINVLAGSTVKAASDAAIYNADGDSVVNIYDASEASNSIVGRIDLSTGVDVLNLHGGFSGITSVDGGGQSRDTLNLYDANSTYNASKIIGWDVFNIKNSYLTVDGPLGGNLNVGTAGVAGTGIFLTDGSTLESKQPGLNILGNLTLDSGTTFLSDVNDDAGNLGRGDTYITGFLTNGGTVSIADGAADDDLQVNGLYTGNNGTLVVDTVLGDDTSATDTMTFLGGTAEGATSVVVNNIGGTGAQTVEGIKIINVTGESLGAFSLVGDYEIAGQQAVLGGAYGYTLWKNGISTPDDGDWYLRSQLAPTGSNPGGLLYQPGAPVFEAYAGVLLGLNSLSTLQQRVGNRSWSGGVDTDSKLASEPLSGIEGRGIWGRIEGAHNSIDPAVSTTGSSYDFDTLKFQAGVDFSVLENESGKLIGAVTGHYGHASADISSSFGNGSISTDGAGFGGTLTWYGNSGFYVDGQAQVSWYDSDLGSDVLGNLASGNDGTGYALSLETGKRIGLDNGLSLTPQAQLVYSSVDFDSFTQTYGGEDVAGISLLNNDSLRGRLGLSLDQNKSWRAEDGLVSRSHVYGIANLYYEFLDGTSVDVSGATLASRSDRLWGGVGLGGSYDWNNDKYSLYGEGSINTSLQNVADSYDLKGTVGFRVKW